jgi:hypothetical protein
MSMISRPTYLRRTIAPYAGIILIIFLSSIYLTWIGFTARVWQMFICVLVSWLLFFAWLYFGIRYKIGFNDELISQEASGGAPLLIAYSEITRVTEEVSAAKELLAASRPFRRITIWAERPPGDIIYIDVSLKHFAREDIRRLMLKIHEHRPDLKLPGRWL